MGVITMKKVIFLLLTCLIFKATILQSKAIQDKTFPTVYYNNQSAWAGNVNKFPNGLFDKAGNSLLQDTDFQQVLVAWDLNKVVFDKQFKTSQYIKQTRKELGTAKTLSTAFSFGKLWAKKQLYKQKNDPRGYVWDGMFTTLETTPKGKKTAALLRKFAQDANHLDPHVAVIMEELSFTNHVQNAVLSNMGQGILDFQLELLKKQKLQASLDFHRKHLIQNIITFLSDAKHNLIASKENGWMHKPDYICYETFLKKHPKKSLTIFVDDKLRNITAALEKGLFDIAIQYTTAQDLRKILYHLGKRADGTTQLLVCQKTQQAHTLSAKRFALRKKRAL